MTDTSLTTLRQIAEPVNTAAWAQALRNPVVIGLAALLAVQLLFAALGIGGSRRLAPAVTDTPLAEFAVEQIDQIEIRAPERAAVLVLSRREEGTEPGWVLPSLGDFPAETTRVEQVLHSLAELRRPLPIATSAAARQRFKVADDVFEHQITLTADGQPVARLILGDSPGFRRRYLRPSDDPGVYDVRLEVLNLSSDADGWIAHDQLHLERDQIQRLAADAWVLHKTDEGAWNLINADEDLSDRLDPLKVEALLNTLANLSYRTVLGTEVPAGFDPHAPELALTIDLGEDGKQRRVYLIAELAGERQDSVLKVEDDPYYFKLSDFDLGPLAGLDAAGLLKASEPEETPDALPPVQD